MTNKFANSFFFFWCLSLVKADITSIGFHNTFLFRAQWFCAFRPKIIQVRRHKNPCTKSMTWCIGKKENCLLQELFNEMRENCINDKLFHSIAHIYLQFFSFFFINSKREKLTTWKVIWVKYIFIYILCGASLWLCCCLTAYKNCTFFFLQLMVTEWSWKTLNIALEKKISQNKF
jgi:hypothetical protein